MKYLNILDCSIADGEGVRVALFVSGCSHHCRGCHNPQSWNPDNGKEFTEETKEKIFKLLDRDYIDGLTISGGDPLYCSNADTVLDFCAQVKQRFPNKDIWLYTGYTFEEVKRLKKLMFIDYLVDGEFVLAERDITLPFRGSKNQRIIDIKESVKQNKLVLYKQ